MPWYGGQVVAEVVVGAAVVVGAGVSPGVEAGVDRRTRCRSWPRTSYDLLGGRMFFWV